jgi:hypothetical protein
MLPRYSKQYSQDDPERDADSKPLLSQSYQRSSIESEPPIILPLRLLLLLYLLRRRVDLMSNIRMIQSIPEKEIGNMH